MNISALAEAEKLLFIARQSLSEGKLPQAIDMLNKIVTDFPNFSKAHITLADIYFNKLQDSTTGEEFYKKAIAIADMNTDAFTGYANLMLQQEKYPEALSLLNKAMAIKGAPKDTIYMLLGKLYEMQSRVDDAMNNYKKCITSTLSNSVLEEAELALKRCEVKKKYI
ncbi:MAG: hypothetical protein JST71_09495 [Bacteroidetes bacterium]|nr:hypothetical protein [Bacteroidota bacterium]HNB34387.1 hypothetical protein [Bacteroidia bacterium]HCI59026.1 hypothetical protein [Bacteroidota bacterium]HNC34447.1 hypothetical protein [Bacteroidia bacterium]HND71758.1 hypothetical protein [Bacteroidia bacterium]